MRDHSKILWLARDGGDWCVVEVHTLRPCREVGPYDGEVVYTMSNKGNGVYQVMDFCPEGFFDATGIDVKEGHLFKVRIEILRVENEKGEVVKR